MEWAGVFPAVLTMFDAAGRLDEDAMVAHVEHLVDEGAHGIVVAGTSGEFISLDADERRRVIALTVRAAAGRIPVIAGTGYFSTAQSIRLTEEAADMGASGAIVILPYYQRPTEDEVENHYRAVGEASSIPVVVYNNPVNSGAPPLTSQRLAALYRGGFIKGVKSTFPTVHEVHEVLAETDEGFRVFYGSFMAPLEAMAGGAHGWVSGITNVAVGDAVDLWSAVEGCDLGRARTAWARILPIRLVYTRQLLGPVSDLAIYRGILRLRGQVAGYCRAPLLDLSADQLERLRAILHPSGLVP